MTVGSAAAIGEQVRVAGFGLTGVKVCVAEDPEAVRTAWADLPGSIELVVVTPAAARALSPAQRDGDRPLVAVLPS
ncbi:hypothetical protein [Streptomyces meridianus]|uniref:Uncharacterized protein n=1 Tax=Streptomyces meridianus TaxID=2938945 RepID=A0ABT0XDG0_9ACTN|nr:hypothetical protein [Streptomyces meridianus]MCM2579752.1 hypothetical protein [Streptomyces meridianus]